MLALTLLFALLCVVSASRSDAVCSNFYGRPPLFACVELFLGLQDRQHRFMGVPPIVEQPKPMDVTAAAWALRVTLPRVEYGGNCNIALLPVLRLDGTYTSVVDSYLRIAQTELSPPGVLDLDALVRRCSLIRGIGGFRQVRKSAVPLRREPADKPD